MAVNLVITCDLLRAPLTGIGYYTGHLVTDLLKAPEIDGFAGLYRGRLLDRDALATLARSVLDNGSGPHAGTLTPAALLTAAGRRFFPLLSPAVRELRLRRQARSMANKPGWLLHAPDFIPPHHTGPTVITVHDLSHVRHPASHPRDRVAWLDRQLPRALDRADRIICVSDFTRRELLDLGLVRDESRLSVCYNGCDPGFRPRTAEQVAPLLSRWHLRPGGYILSVATREPRKNLDRLITAYEQLPADLADRYPLVLAGAAGWKGSTLDERIARSRRRIIVTGYLERADLQALLSGAVLFAYVSLYEGFGLPVVEAMASGVPVICSDSGALAEVAGNWGYTVNPLDPGAIRDAMAMMLGDDEVRQRYGRAGPVRAREFSWQRCARETVAVYQSVIDE